ncbi:radical SAM/SPASM domain-containing protein [uncultured Clostridium sp.]|uniref:radical SAM/SPASM domain-containing protein n=1 Tax=uncultured Clostridium sp. TaxID=59620 RepID=UPI00258B7AE5|nr:radical SAM protein [uncultured Clostridium sp.]MDU1347900.1 radical SAM protein [Clostridium argentinense]
MTNKLNSKITSDIWKEHSVMSKLSGPISVSFDITTKCNLKCVHCYNNSGAENNTNELSDEEILDVARQIAELHPLSVCLCGGETLCRKNIVDIAKILGENVGGLSMVSNGFAMTDQKIKELKVNNLQQVQISLDGINKYQHDTFRGVKGSFDRAVNAIKMLKANNISRIATSLVPNKLNYKSIEDYITLCYSLGVNSIRIMPFIPSGRGKTIGRSLILDDREYFQFVRGLLRKAKFYGDKIDVEWGDPLDHMRRMPYNAQHGINTYCMEVKANGDITVTTYLPIVVGNCKKHSLKEYWDGGYNFIWKNEEVLEYINKIQNIYDFDKFEPAPYTGEKIYIDLLK